MLGERAASAASRGSVNGSTPHRTRHGSHALETPSERLGRSGSIDLALCVQWGVSMLVISRRKGQRVSIGDEIELVVTEVHRSSVKLGIRAPRGLTVLRGEIRDSIEEANRMAAESSVEDTGVLAPAKPAPGVEISAIPVTVLRRPARPKDVKPA
jgi:carbon storage regulator